MNILLLSTGGGGGNILRSVKTLFQRDLLVTEQTDPDYADRLRQAVTTRFLDTNEFSLMDVPSEERLLIGSRTTGRLGSRHNPDVARQALEESRAEVTALVEQHAAIVLIGTGGKGTGAGTMFPLAQLARQHRKLVIPIFVRPSFERHEVDKKRFDHAAKVVERFDGAKIRLMEILNDRGYVDADPQPQPVVWERMNLPIARGLRGLIYVLWDLSQVDPSDLSTLLAGEGRLRIGFAELDPAPGRDPGEHEIEQAVRQCWDNPYYAFSKPVGTSLICIQGDWSNIADAAIKGRLAVSAVAGKPDSPYTPLFARATRSPKPWGVTALFAEHTGAHVPLDVNWAFDREPVPAPASQPRTSAAVVSTKPSPMPSTSSDGPATATPATREPEPPLPMEPTAFSSLWDFAIAVNRSEPAAVALAGNGSDGGVPIDPAELRKLVGTVWFRAVFQRLSDGWRNRLWQVLQERVPIQNHGVRIGRRTMQLREIEYSQLDEIAGRGDIPETLRADVHLMLAIGRLWGESALRQCQFTGDLPPATSSRFGDIFSVFR